MMSEVESVSGGNAEVDVMGPVARARMRAHGMADRIAWAAGFAGELRPGAVVRLKSGSPAMTVAVFDLTDGLIYCHWIAGGRPFAARYCAEMLEPEKPGERGEAPGKRGAHPRGASDGPGVSPDAAITAESEGESGENDSPGAAITAESEGES
jgi:uncharacterized protein YodC (DUF2158 family)